MGVVSDIERYDQGSITYGFFIAFLRRASRGISRVWRDAGKF